jgi:ubiquinone/menaquinone biosynthesis C-methylase UbiE
MATADQSDTATKLNRTRPPPDQYDPTGSEAYRGQAGGYDQRTEQFQHWRGLLIDRLRAGPGDTVLDVGCGTGLCHPLLQEKIGPTGTIIGIDASAQMLKVAVDRVTENGWNNVQLITAPVAEAEFDIMADGVIFCAVHDVMQSPAALANVFDHVRPGAAVAAIGGKFPAPWLWSLRKWVTDLHTPFITDFTGFDQPWGQLTEHVPDLQIQQLAGGTGYLALGHTPATLHQSPSADIRTATAGPLIAHPTKGTAA